jgi:prefoldin subunit 5
MTEADIRQDVQNNKIVFYQDEVSILLDKIDRLNKRINTLEAALHKINKRLNDSDSWLAQSIDARKIAEKALKSK